MGANCKEDDAVMISYTKHLVKEMKTIEAKKTQLEMLMSYLYFSLSQVLKNGLLLWQEN